MLFKGMVIICGGAIGGSVGAITGFSRGISYPPLLDPDMFFKTSVSLGIMSGSSFSIACVSSPLIGGSGFLLSSYGIYSLWKYSEVEHPRW